MIKAGLTGNIGSGKTTVARIFQALGAAVFNADTEAKKILNESKHQKVLIEYFGHHILAADRTIDRKYLAQVIFNDEKALDFINDLIHPLVRERFDEFCEKHCKSPVCFYEAAILIETGYYKQLDKVIFVAAPEELRIQRVVARDNISVEAVKERMKNQLPEDQKTGLADHIIVNDNLTPLLEQCLHVFNKLESKNSQIDTGGS